MLVLKTNLHAHLQACIDSEEQQPQGHARRGKQGAYRMVHAVVDADLDTTEIVKRMSARKTFSVLLERQAPYAEAFQSILDLLQGYEAGTEATRAILDAPVTELP